MTCYQDCHRHYGYLTHETTIARKLLERHGRPCLETVKELRNETDMPIAECADMLRCMWRDIELERLAGENAKLRDLVKGMWYCAHEAHGMCARVPVGGERPFTCCPLYDFDAKEYRCEKLILELRVVVDG